MLYCAICIDENTQVCTATIVFRRHRWFRLIKNWAWFINHVDGDGASPSVLRMILICGNHVLNLISGGPFRGPRVPSQTRCFEGAAQSFRGARPPRNSTTDYNPSILVVSTKQCNIWAFNKLFHHVCIYVCIHIVQLTCDLLVTCEAACFTLLTHILAI